MNLVSDREDPISVIDSLGDSTYDLSSVDHLTPLPPELFAITLSYLSANDVISLCRVSNSIYQQIPAREAYRKHITDEAYQTRGWGNDLHPRCCPDTECHSRQCCLRASALLLKAVACNSHDGVENFLRAGASPNIIWHQLYTWPARPEEDFTGSRISSIDHPLLGLGPHEFFTTPLHTAAYHGYFEIVTTLLQFGADPESLDSRGLCRCEVCNTDEDSRYHWWMSYEPFWGESLQQYRPKASPLHIAKWRGCSRVKELLVDYAK